MLRRLSANDSRFKTVSFHDGLNLLVADTTEDSSPNDSRNSSGKSSVIELIHFLLGARAAGAPPSKKALKRMTFTLEMEWPTLDGGLLCVRRSGARPGTVVLSPDVSSSGNSNNALFDTPGPAEISLPEWNRCIERDLFSVPADTDGVSGRVMLSFLARRESAHGFNEATRTFARQAEAEATTNLAYLLGLDWQLADGYRQLKAREETRAQLRKAVNDPVWGRIVGNTADLRGQITLAQDQVARLQQQVSSYQVVPQYEDLKTQADALNAQIKQLAQDDVIDTHNLAELRQAVTETADVEVDYLEPVYRELGIVLSPQIRRRFEDVQAFHHSIVRNRRRYLEEEITERSVRMAERRTERARLGEEQARLLRLLNEGGALEALTVLQQALAREEATLATLRHRYDAAQTLEASALQIKAKRLELEQAVNNDLEERLQQTDEATLLFSQFAERLYRERRQAYLAIKAGRSSLKITPTIDSDDSRGIHSMVIFCFDLTVAVLAHRHGRGPDFLIHDSHLFDGVDERQLAAAFLLASEVAEREGMQYIATINSDDLRKTERHGFDSSQYVCSPRLTDTLETGGLFGFRF
ncbi:ABC-three component system protein [Streptomyces sp. NPDC088400]|uniref:ABC-three component system protein n=1 Tax=Streptomyces sp. NPDC088400 TaxID=3365861 RepID=UPI0037FCB98D